MLPPELSKLTARFSNDQTGKVSADGLLNTLPQNRYLRHGLLRDVLELHSRGDCESESLARALIFAGTQLLTAMGVGHTQGEDSRATESGILHDSPSGSVWQVQK